MTPKLPPLAPQALAAEKSRLRAQFMAQRQAMQPQELQAISAAVRAHIAGWLEAHPAVHTVCLFSPIRAELDLMPLAAQLPGLTVALPVITPVGRSMAFYVWGPQTPRHVNRFGITEPDPAAGAALVTVDAGALILVPALAVDADGVRLGYGGGYYDRYLAAGSGAWTMAVAAAAFVVPRLPHGSHDQHVRAVATEQGVRLIP